MSSRAQSGSHRGAAKQFSKSSHEKKAKEKKQQQNTSGMYAPEHEEATPQEQQQKTLGSLNSLGNQVFALSPFSHYFDDWLVNLRQVISEFESATAVDEQFTKERTQVFQDVEAAFAELRVQESDLSGEAKELADNNHLLVETDKDYAEKTRELSNRRNADVQRLSVQIRELEDEVASQEQAKFAFYKVMAKRRAAQGLENSRQALKAAKNELEVTLSSFTADQDKLHDSYEKKKQEITGKVEMLHKALEKFETDTSISARQTACSSLATSINALLQRNPSATPPSTQTS